jgi:hypothetical protein
MKRITLEQQARAIEAWKSQNGITGRNYVPVNEGKRRTPSKRSLLRAIAEEADRRGRKPIFPAKF